MGVWKKNFIKRLLKRHKNCRHYMNDEYSKLRSEWYEKLKQSGFNDIESPLGRDKGDYRGRNENLEKVIKRYTPEKQAFYENCRHYVENGSFDYEEDKIIFSKFAEGEVMRSISLSVSLPLTTVFKIIRKYVRRINNA